ncbi:VWA domain-containing protein [Paenibacillus sp. Marseille-P2973]|uniref:vWA domain-containing protein n=1 Tax=Paenibacillus sp. Marseille-P2973 TaxID=1871032 RepID=UPI001B37FF5C|nr:VWA domain-containing protein [Paenibacillus sp. Marseille-P2973]
MSYQIQATSETPALIIYLLDISGSMTLEFEGRRRMDIVNEALNTAIRQIVYRSTKGSRLSPRYRIAILAYSDEVYDLLDGVKSIDRIANSGSLPQLYPKRFTDTAKAFRQAEKILQSELPNLQYSPAPLVCHMTDGVYTGEDPEPIAERIKAMEVPDGRVLVENIFITDEAVGGKIRDIKAWGGMQPGSFSGDPYTEKLKRMSSVLPESYREMMIESSYSLRQGALMMLPGTSADLIALGFQMSAATPIG